MGVGIGPDSLPAIVHAGAAGDGIAGFGAQQREPTRWARGDARCACFVGLFVFVIVCPKCGKSPYIRVRFREDGRERIKYSAPLMETVCSRCGNDFY